MERPSNLQRLLALGASLGFAAGLSACHSKSGGTEAATSVADPLVSAPHPLDRLAPDELAAGSASAFGFPIPARMVVDRFFPDAVHASGQVTPEALLEYVRERVLVEHIEVGGRHDVFPK